MSRKTAVVTDATEEAKESGSTYELTYEPDGSSFTVRENLVDILERELLGPIDGRDELLPFDPRSQYLVGHIAPVRLTGASAGSADTGANSERGELAEARADENAVTEAGSWCAGVRRRRRRGRCRRRCG